MTTTTTTPTKTTRMSGVTDQQLLDLERGYWDAWKDRDARAIGRMTAEASTIVGASGVAVVDSAQMRKLLDGATYRIRDYRIDPKTTRIQRISDDAVAITYGVHEDLEVEGKRVQLDAFDASVWKMTDDGWTCVLHTESIAGDGFGRDRIAGTRTS